MCTLKVYLITEKKKRMVRSRVKRIWEQHSISGIDLDSTNLDSEILTFDSLNWLLIGFWKYFSMQINGTNKMGKV